MQRERNGTENKNPQTLLRLNSKVMKEWKRIGWKPCNHTTVETTVEHFTCQQSDVGCRQHPLMQSNLYLQGITACMNGLFFINRSHPLLKHLIQDYAVNLFLQTSKASLHSFWSFDGIMLVMWGFQFQGQVNGIKFCVQWITQSNIFSCLHSSAAWVLKRKVTGNQKHVHFGCSIGETDTVCCNSTGKVFSCTL